ncbi:hypothetical protein M9Y10_012151 [Tritrichomonas musculus]|uniref:Uncharacterized protein n=1 Tax=Tritrichomonas musculus TaxID=1915356 RepID=A0ABR2ICC2_9EUKA
MSQDQPQPNFSPIKTIEYKSPSKKQFDISSNVLNDREILNKIDARFDFFDSSFQRICNDINGNIVALDNNVRLVYESVSEIKKSQKALQESQQALRDSIQETIQNSIQQSMRAMETTIISRINSQQDRQFSKEKQFITSVY